MPDFNLSEQTKKKYNNSWNLIKFKDNKQEELYFIYSVDLSETDSSESFLIHLSSGPYIPGVSVRYKDIIIIDKFPPNRIAIDETGNIFFFSRMPERQYRKGISSSTCMAFSPLANAVCESVRRQGIEKLAIYGLTDSRSGGFLEVCKKNINNKLDKLSYILICNLFTDIERKYIDVFENLDHDISSIIDANWFLSHSYFSNDYLLWRNDNVYAVVSKSDPYSVTPLYGFLNQELKDFFFRKTKKFIQLKKPLYE